jgi:predicted transglutaminase-like cysteine proteinase
MSIVSAVRLGAIVAILSSVFITTAEATDAGHDPFMATVGVTTRPAGHNEFCKRYPAECRVKTRKEPRVHLTAERWNELVEVNNLVNWAVTPVTDEELFGKEEAWVYPTTKGDCEDFVLEKRRDLIKRGWPVGALLITVVRQTNGDGHAVLTALTDRGDLVLDNLEPQVKVWSQTEYQYVKRQSEMDSGRWVAIDDARTSSVGSLAR